VQRTKEKSAEEHGAGFTRQEGCTERLGADHSCHCDRPLGKQDDEEGGNELEIRNSMPYETLAGHSYSIDLIIELGST